MKRSHLAWMRPFFAIEGKCGAFWDIQNSVRTEIASLLIN